jgi:Zn-dependent protease
MLLEIVNNGVQMEFGSESIEQTQTEPTLSGLLVGLLWTLLTLPVAMLILFGLLFVFTLPILPGLALHEFGHYAALRKADVEIESYGLLFSGPILNGAFVNPDSEEIEEKDVDTQFSVLAGGIANNLLYGTVLLGGSLLLFTNPLTKITGGIEVQIQQPLPAILFWIACFEYAMAFANACPVGRLDGGKFVQVAEERLANSQ